MRLSKCPFGSSVALMLALAGTAWTQAPGTGGISGTVLDPSGRAIQAASVIAHETATHAARQVATDSEGNFRLALLEPGTYVLTISHPGFASTDTTAIQVAVADTATIRFTLPLAGASEKIDVTAHPDIAQTEGDTLGRLVGTELITEVPLSNRNYTQILSLSPGVSVPLPDATSLGRGSQNVQDVGNKPTGNNIQFNGIDANNLAENSAMNAGEEVGVAVPAPDTIEQFKVQTANYDAAYGRGNGANVDVVSRSGTNSLHGSAWEFVRNNLFNANDFFAKLDGTPRPTLKQNQFGASLGGPLWRSHTFFFVAYQGTRSVNAEAQGSEVTTLLPQLTNDRSAATLGAQFCPNAPGRNPAPYLTYAGGTQVACDGSNISPAALNLLNSRLPNGEFAIPSPQIALPSSDPTQFPVGQSTFALAGRYNEDQYTANLDQNLSASDSASLRFFFARAPLTLPFSPNAATVPGWGTNELDHNIMTVLSETHIFSSSFINLARAGFMRFDGRSAVANPFSTADLGIDSPTGARSSNLAAPGLMLDGLFIVGDAGTPSQSQLTNSYIAQDLLSLSRGKHFLRTGIEFKRHQVTVDAPFTTSGLMDIRTFDDFLLGQSAAQNGSPSGISNVTTSYAGSGNFRKDERYSDFAAFIQDDLRASSRLTLNAGLRYEIFGAPVEAHGHLATFDPSIAVGNVPPQGTYSGFVVPSNFPGQAPTGVVRTPYKGLWPNHFHDLSPRVGFAWQLTREPRLLLRGGAGLYYDRISGNLVESIITQPPYALFAFSYDALNGGASLEHPFSPTLPPPSAFPQFPLRLAGQGPSLSAISPHVIDPYTYEANLNLQYAFAHNYLAEIGYVYTRSLHEVGCYEFNQALLASPTNPINGETTNTAANVAARLPYQGFSAGSEICDTLYNANYNGLLASLTKRLSHGLEFLASYTYSKTLDETSGSGGASFYETALVTNNQFNPRQAYGPSDYDRRHRAVLSLVYRTPAFNSLAKPARILLTGWTVSAIAVAQSGTPLTITDPSAGLVYGNFENRAAAPTGNPYTTGSLYNRVLHGYLDPSAFPSAPEAPFGSGPQDTDFGNSSTGFLRGPGQRNIDAAIERAFPLHEAHTLHLRAEFFNLTNTTQFANPDTSVTDPTFGLITQKSANPRIIQFAAKYTF